MYLFVPDAIVTLLDVIAPVVDFVLDNHPAVVTEYPPLTTPLLVTLPSGSIVQ